MATHSKQDFIDTNIKATQNLLTAAIEQGTRSFVYTSKTSTFVHALAPKWQKEKLRNIINKYIRDVNHNHLNRPVPVFQ